MHEGFGLVGGELEGAEVVVETMRVNDRVVTKSTAGTVARMNAFPGNNTRGFGVNNTICYARRR